MLVTDGPYVETKEFLGGFAVVDVPDDEAAKMWAGKIAEACGWPRGEVRRRRKARRPPRSVVRYRAAPEPPDSPTAPPFRQPATLDP